MKQHAWRLTHQDYSAARWVCLKVQGVELQHGV